MRALGVNVDLELGTASGGDAKGDVLANIENLTGSALADALSGTAGDNVFDGGLGGDLIDGRGGIDTIDRKNFGHGLVQRLLSGQIVLQRLRKKLSGDPGQPFIETVRGVGYRIPAGEGRV